jgi:hypothetical protein
VLDTQLIRVLFFPFKTGLRKSQQVLLKLHTAGKIGRWKHESGYVYGSKSGRWEHRLMVNYVRTWFKIITQGWASVHSWIYEPDYTFIRADSLVTLKTDHGFRFAFIEVERASDKNRFNKVQKYNALYEAVNSGKYQESFWVKMGSVFPETHIICLTEERKKIALRRVQEDNRNGLDFVVKLFPDIQKEVLL